MALDFTLVLRAETAAAKAELEATARGIQGVSVATNKATTASKAGATAAQAEAAARRAASQANQAYTRSTQQAAGATGNLVAQFNDIGMMLAAGQNPLQLAIQQGTQITQAFGGAGAAGAAGMLKTAFFEMLNPLNLITLGVIYFGAQAVQALMGAGAEAEAVAGRFDKIREAAAATQTEIDKLRFGVDEEYQVDLLRQQLDLRSQYNAKVGELNSYLATTTDSIDRQRISTADLRAEIAAIVTEYTEISAALADQQNRSAQLAVMKGVEAQRAGELVAKQQEAERAAAALQDRVKATVANLASADGSKLVSAFQSAFPVASQLLGLAQGIVATIGQAQADAAYGATIGGGRGLGPQGPALDPYGFRAQLARDNRSAPSIPGAAGSGGGAAAARDEADALQELITSLEGEIEALRVTNPIQQEMLKHRDALAGATDAERLKVEELIATREREAAAMEAASQRAEFFSDTGTNALDAMIAKGASFNEVLKQIASSLLQAAYQAAMMGTGPFGDFFGGGNILSGLFGAGKAAGGMIYGPGTATSDSILTPLSNGEYVVNAKATAKNRHLLEAINAGGRPGFAQGGMVGGEGGGGMVAGRSGRQMPATVLIDLRGVEGDRAIEQKVRRGAAEVVAMYDREGLAVSVQRVSRDPKRRG